MRHDYDLPPDWEAMTPEEKDRWFKQERARRQAVAQDTPTAKRFEKAKRRQERRAASRSETREVKE